MAENQQHQKKQFTVPSRDELIQQIKDLDQDIEHVTLNLIKCDFNATQNDIKKTFPNFNFVKVKNYNPGSFQVIFEMKIDAINFIRNQYDKKILNRRFFIKLGRQQKQVVQDWTGVGYVPRQFKGPHKPHHNQNKQGGNHKNKKHQTTQGNKQQKTEQKVEQPKKQVQNTQQKQQTKQVHQPEQKKREGKHIPKNQNAPKKTEYKKPANKPQRQGQKKTTEAPHQTQIKKEAQNPAKKTEQTHKKEDKKTVHKQQKQQPVPQKKQEDDGWIVVPGSKNKKR